MMKLCATVVMAASVLLAGSAGAHEDPRVTDAKAVAASWLVLLDAGQYADTWTQSASMFQAAVTQENWVNVVKPMRAPLGAVTSRTFKTAQFTRSMPAVPDGEYVVIQYNTVFENKAGAVETITPMRDKDGKWRISGYFVR
jgi:hypothetical protein